MNKFMTHSSTLMGLFFLFAFFLGGCGDKDVKSPSNASNESASVSVSKCAPASTSESVSATPFKLPSVLLDAEWLKAHHQEPGLVIIDVRPTELYQSGHIPCSISINFEDTYSSKEGQKHNVASPEKIAEVLGKAGVGMNSTVVIYGTSAKYKSAARLFWVLELHGHQNVGVLDGGLPAWSQTGEATSVTISQRTPVIFEAKLDETRRASKEEVMEVLKTGKGKLIDARPAIFYMGEKTYPGLQSGHIPTARSAPFTQLFQTINGVSHFTLEAWSKVAKEEGTEKSIMYCNSGRAGSVGYLGMRAMGKDVALFDGSMTTWSAEGLPVVKGTETGEFKPAPSE